MRGPRATPYASPCLGHALPLHPPSRASFHADQTPDGAGVRKLGEDFPDGIPILYFVSQTALSTRPAIAIRKKLGYRKAADLLIDMPEYLTVVRDPFTPGDFKLFPSPRLVEEIKQADAEAAEKEEKKKEREEAAMKEWEELRKKDEEWAKGGFLLEGEDLEDLEEKGSVEISPSEKELGAETSEEGSQELRLVEEQGPEKLQEEEGEEEGEVQQEEEEGGPPRKRYVRKKGHKERFKVDKNAMEYGTEKSIGGTDITLEDLLKKWEKEEPPEEPKTRWYEKEELDPMDMLKATGMQMDDEADSAWAASTQKKPAAEAAQEEEVVVEDVLELDDDWEVVEGSPYQPHGPCYPLSGISPQQHITRMTLWPSACQWRQDIRLWCWWHKMIIG